MAKEVMRRQAADNEYLHRDFHGALSTAIQYLDEHYGEEAVREYLRDFTNVFYAPLKQDLRARGLVALKEHWARVYEIEGGEIEMTLTADELVLRVAACPAVGHMHAQGYPVARLWSETTRTVNEALCAGSDFAAELVAYDQETGRSTQRFYRRQP